MKKGNVCIIAAVVMFLVECAVIWYFANHTEISLPLWIPYEMAWTFYGAWMIAVPVLLIVGIILKIKKK